MESFAKNFETLCYQSMGILEHQMLKDDPKQADLIAKKDVLRNALIKKLDGDEKLIDAYDEACSDVDFRPALYIYQQGFQDSVYLLRWMGLLEGFPELK